MAILQVRAMRGWNKSETSRHFLVSDDTIREWLRRADDDSPVQAPTPVNRFPDFVRYAARTNQALLPNARKGEDCGQVGQSRYSHRQDDGRADPEGASRRPAKSNQRYFRQTVSSPPTRDPDPPRCISAAFRRIVALVVCAGRRIGDFPIALATITRRIVEPSPLSRCDSPQHSLDKRSRRKLLGLHTSAAPKVISCWQCASPTQVTAVRFVHPVVPLSLRPRLLRVGLPTALAPTRAGRIRFDSDRPFRRAWDPPQWGTVGQPMAAIDRG